MSNIWVIYLHGFIAVELFYAPKGFYCFIILLIVYQVSCYFANAKVHSKNGTGSIAGIVKRNRTGIIKLSSAENGVSNRIFLGR